MKCEECGKELIKIANLNDDNFMLVEKFDRLDSTSKSMMDAEVVKDIKFEKPEEVYDYFKRAFDSCVEAAIIRDKLSLDACAENNMSFKNYKNIVIKYDESNVPFAFLHS